MFFQLALLADAEFSMKRTNYKGSNTFIAVSLSEDSKEAQPPSSSVSFFQTQLFAMYLNAHNVIYFV